MPLPYEVDTFHDYLHAIPSSSAKGLKDFSLKKNRFDTIREGALIFNEILSTIGAKKVITSGVGVREGVYLEQALKEEHLSYPKDINPSMISILDRFKPYITVEKRKKHTLQMASSLYETLQTEIEDEMSYASALRDALKLSSIGNTLTIYKATSDCLLYCDARAELWLYTRRDDTYLHAAAHAREKFTA